LKDPNGPPQNQKTPNGEKDYLREVTIAKASKMTRRRGEKEIVPLRSISTKHTLRCPTGCSQKRILAQTQNEVRRLSFGGLRLGNQGGPCWDLQNYVLITFIAEERREKR